MWSFSWKQTSAFKRLLEILLLALKVCTGFTTDAMWVNTKLYSVTSKPTKTVADAFRPLRAHQCYWTIEWWTSHKWSPHRNSSVFIVMCIFLMFRYIFSVFTTSSVLTIRRTSLMRSSPLSCSVALMSP